MTENDTPPVVSVCIATFRRPEGLSRLIRSLVEQKGVNFPWEIVVIDNDATGSARLEVANWQASNPRPAIHYAIEEEQNISLARNRSVSKARGEWVAFVDDDESVSPGWLASYWKMTENSPADGYFGPVLPAADGPVPEWFDVDAFLARARPQDGNIVDASHTRTTNAFIRRELLLGERFDPDFGISGGGDFELFGRLIDRGAEFRWCDGAQSTEFYPDSRLTLSWLLRRSFRGGHTYSRVNLLRKSNLATQFAAAGKAVLAAAALVIALPFSLLGGFQSCISVLRKLCVQAGHLWAFLGLDYNEYRNPRR